MNGIAQGVKCGNHNGERVYHDTAAEVRACYQGGITREAITAKRVDSLMNSGTREQSREVLARLAKQASPYTPPARPATEKMAKYAADLLGTRVYPQGWSLGDADVDTLTFDMAKQIIDTLKDQPRKDAEAPNRPEPKAVAPWRKLAEQVPDGRYAVRYEGDKAHFYRISRSKKGYVKVQEQASDSWFEKRYVEYTKIFEAIIEAGVEESGVLYGLLIGECRKCGRALTDENNPYKAIGYGPDCGSK